MRTVPAAVLAAAVVVLTGCSGAAAPRSAPPTSAPVPSATTSAAAPTTTTPPTVATPPAAPPPAPVALPAAPAPTVDGVCPYLSAADVSAFNGDKVLGVRLDPTYMPPACFFTRGDGSQQLSVWVFRASSATEASAAVDRAAPVATTDPADQPAGWIGGSSGGANGAVYAVAKGPVAVVIMSSQGQSVKARRVAEQVITALGL